MLLWTFRYTQSFRCKIIIIIIIPLHTLGTCWSIFVHVCEFSIYIFYNLLDCKKKNHFVGSEIYRQILKDAVGEITSIMTPKGESLASEPTLFWIADEFRISDCSKKCSCIFAKNIAASDRKSMFNGQF